MSFNVPYAITQNLGKVSFAAARERVTAALRGEGFGVITEIDLQSTFRAKLGRETRPYTILGACNPQLASQALEILPESGLMLPCNVVITEDEHGDVLVAAASPIAMFQMVGDPGGLAVIAADAETRLRRAVAMLSAGA
jgi:uncharacterized protein (DUF302 family)